jgi:hypothetical protein
MRLIDVGLDLTSERVRLSGEIEREYTGDRSEIFFEFNRSGDDTSESKANADPFAAAMLIRAMRADETLEIGSPISPQLCFRLKRIRDIFHTWHPEFANIDLRTIARSEETVGAKVSAAAFFSGGVDSFYTLLKHKYGHGTLPVPLTQIIFMRGVERTAEESNDVETSEKWAREVASALGIRIISGETNIRASLSGLRNEINWDDHYLGSALAAVALALPFRLGYVCIPSAFSYNHLIAHGSTPLLDEMYSTERLSLIHDGSEVTRASKVAKMIEWDRDLVLARLRVCWLNAGGAFNCGKCRKCVRTAVPLRVLGVWQHAQFRDKSTDHWERVIGADHPIFAEENLQFARERGADSELIALLERVVRRNRRNTGLSAVVRNSPLSGLRPAWHLINRCIRFNRGLFSR